MQTRTLIAQEIVQVLQSAGLLRAFHMQDTKQAFASHTTDSRKVTQDGLFIAYQGVSFDAHTAVSELQKKYQGLGFIVERPEHFHSMQATNAFVCQVNDSREAWSWLAAHVNGNPHDKLRMIGITGTNGKTSTVWFIRQLLRTINEACLILGTLGV